MNTLIRYPLRSLFVGASLAMLLSAEPAQAYVPGDSVVLPLFMDTRGNPSSLPGTGWYTMAVIQNTTKYLANVRVTAKPKGVGAPSFSTTFPLPAGSSTVVRPDNTTWIPANASSTFPTGNFEGSLLIESDQGMGTGLVVIGELANIPLGSMGVAGGTAKGFYNGIHVNSSSGTLAFPMMKSGFNGKSTVVYMKNTSTIIGSATLKLKTNDGMTYATDPMTLNAGESKAVRGVDFKSGTETWTKTCTGGANVGQPGVACFGAATLESNTANVTFAAIAVQRAVAVTSPSPSVHVANFQPIATGPVSCPVFRNAYQTTARSGVSIMNTGTSTVDITLKLIADTTFTQYTQMFQGVLPGTSVAATGWAVNIGGFPDGAIGAATITSFITGIGTPDNHIIAAVSESGVGTNESSYQCSRGSERLLAPFVKFDYSDVNHPGKATSEVRIQNTGTGSDTLIGSYYCRGGATGFESYSVSKPLPGGGSVEINSASFITADPPQQGIPAQRMCTASFFAWNGSPLVGTVTERSSSNSPADDATYELESFVVETSVGGATTMCTGCPSCCSASAPLFVP